MTEQEELEFKQLKEENERLKKEKSTRIYLKVSQKGALSLYGMGRFPVTLYKEQWEKVLDFSDEIKTFIKENDSELKAKN